jgi:hypothetical protein
MAKKRTPDDLRHWSLAKEHIGDQLKRHYQACTTDELPPRLITALKMLDEQTEPPELPADQLAPARDIEN